MYFKRSFFKYFTFHNSYRDYLIFIIGIPLLIIFCLIDSEILHFKKRIEKENIEIVDWKQHFLVGYEVHVDSILHDSIFWAAIGLQGTYIQIVSNPQEDYPYLVAEIGSDYTNISISKKIKYHTFGQDKLKLARAQQTYDTINKLFGLEGKDRFLSFDADLAEHEKAHKKPIIKVPQKKVNPPVENKIVARDLADTDNYFKKLSDIYEAIKHNLCEKGVATKRERFQTIYKQYEKDKLYTHRGECHNKIDFWYKQIENCQNIKIEEPKKMELSENDYLGQELKKYKGKIEKSNNLCKGHKNARKKFLDKWEDYLNGENYSKSGTFHKEMLEFSELIKDCPN